MKQTKSPTQIGTETNTESISVETLREELEGTGPAEDSGSAVSEAVDDVETSLFGGDSFAYQEAHIKSSLDELLVALVALRDADTHGKQLLDDLSEQFNTMLSPGTVYPRLHELCDEGVLDQRELVKTKEYVLNDTDNARSNIAAAARQHLALGMLFHTTLQKTNLE